MTEQDGSHDSDFLIGWWNIKNHKLRVRLRGSKDWDRFDATLDVRPILGGLDRLPPDSHGVRSSLAKYTIL